MLARSRRLVAPLTAVFGLVCLLAVVLAGGTSHARVQPYYVVKGIGDAKLRPRVLFVLDTSGTMGLRAQASEEKCAWNECEAGGATTQSRIAAARSAVRDIIASTGDVADFALMTFDQYTAPATSVPKKCSGKRFEWVTTYGFDGWGDIEHYSGYTGTWRLCDDEHRPYPYLRWDALGVGSVIGADDQSGDVPASPLVSTASGSMTASSNASRKVQWFPRFMGVRANLNATTDPDGSILSATIGDWASNDSDRQNNVWGRDFYYWPYVDGFPGYSTYRVSENGSPQFLGVVQQDWQTDAAMLYAPFYLDLADGPVPTDAWGPASRDEATRELLARTAALVEGGLDAPGGNPAGQDTAGGTPWASAIGEIPTDPPTSNEIASHSTVASYLKFVTQTSEADVCAPTTAVIITDGDPAPSSEGGHQLYEELAALRNELGVDVYVVGFFLDSDQLHEMACAAAGACSGNCGSPCDDTPAANWDTCNDASDPATGCAFLADSPAALAEVLTGIVESQLSLDVEAGPGSSVREFGVGADGAAGQGAIVQTTVRAYTEWPGWRGHVVRQACTDEDPDSPGDLAPWCIDTPFDVDELEETFGPCPQQRTWDAGECLKLTDWKDRRLFTHAADRSAVAIAKDDGTASAEFTAELVALGLMSAAEAASQADDFAAFLLGRDWPEGWKLPGLANSAPVVVRRIPKHQPDYTPSVAIRDPHCAGRRLSDVAASGLPNSLEAFAAAAWDDGALLQSPSPHREYQEAVLVGDDLGVLHAFGLDSGNELWGLLPRELLASAMTQWQYGAAKSGQPDAIDDHVYGIAATINHGFVYDDTTAPKKWRHLGVIGLGAGGTELLALDLSHMSPASQGGPFEILWTSEDPALKASYDAWAGETWARPALTYDVPGDNLTVEPTARLVFGTGYPRAGAGAEAGRTLMLADAVSGEVLEHAVIETDVGAFEPTFGTLVDPAIASHCISRYWAEIQEAYFADPAGRVYRWDVGNDHVADSGGTWGEVAVPAVELTACEGSGSTCTVGARGEPFVFGPAVSASGRLDAPGGATSGATPLGVDQFLVALASGSPSEDASSADSTFHSSLYLLVDDHSKGDPHAGFDVPANAPKQTVATLGSHAHFARLAVSDMTRTRTVTPFAGASTYVESAGFARSTRPIRAPRIDVMGVVDAKTVADAGGPTVIDGVEVYTITYTLYEPPSQSCDSRWYDDATQTWHVDEGATYEVKLRLTALAGSGFDFTSGAQGGPASFAAGYTTGLTLESVTQVASGECSDGNCGPQPTVPSSEPCDENASEMPEELGGFAVAVHATQIVGFSPIE